MTALIGLASGILLLASFSLGMMVGQGKARHFIGWEEGYGRSMGMLRVDGHKPLPFLMPLPGTRGVFGRVLMVSDSALVVQGKDGVEQSVAVTPLTDIRIGSSRGTLEAIHADGMVAVFGAPTGQGQIEAKLIRVFSRP